MGVENGGVKQAKSQEHRDLGPLQVTGRKKMDAYSSSKGQQQECQGAGVWADKGDQEPTPNPGKEGKTYPKCSGWSGSVPRGLKAGPPDSRVKLLSSVYTPHHGSQPGTGSSLLSLKTQTPLWQAARALCVQVT